MIFFLYIYFTCLSFYSQSNIFFSGSLGLLAFTLSLFIRIPPYLFSSDLKLLFSSLSFRKDFSFPILSSVRVLPSSAACCCDSFLTLRSISSSLVAELEEIRFTLEEFYKHWIFIALSLVGVAASDWFWFWLIRGGKKLSEILITLRLVSRKSALVLTSSAGISRWLILRGDNRFSFPFW